MPTYPESIGRLLNFSANSCNSLANSLLSEHDLSLPQWVILSALWREDGMLVSELARYTGSNLPATSRIVDRMENNGLIRREMDQNDRRAVRVFVSEKAAGLSDLQNFYEEINSRLMKGFSAKEQALLFDLLQRVIDNAKTE